MARPSADASDECAEVDPEHILAAERGPEPRDLGNAVQIGTAGEEGAVDGAHGCSDDPARTQSGLDEGVHHPDL